MDFRDKLLQNMGSEILAQWNSFDPKPDQLIDILNQLSDVINQIKILNEEKKISAAKIGRLKKNNADCSSVIEEQKLLKKKLKDFKQNKQILEGSIRSFFLNKKDNNDIPDRFKIESDGSFIQTLSTINIINVDELPDDKIDKYVDSHIRSTPYHYTCWRNLIKSLFNHDDMSMIAVNHNKNIVGLLPLIRLKSYLFGDFVVSMPYFNYGGPLADDLEIENKLIESAIEICRNNDLEHIELRELKIRDGLQSKQEKISMIRKLPGSVEELSTEIGTKLRAQINRSKDHNPNIQIGKLELINDFYKVFSTNMRDLGTPVYSKEFFYRVIETWYDESHIVIVYINNKPVASALLIGYRNMLEIPWASALRKTNNLGINMFMYWNILKFAIESGYAFFDFGRSSKDSGTYKFKKQWGASPYQNYWNYWLPEGEGLPQINPNNVKYKLLISAWKKLPVFVSNLIGPPIVKNIP